MRKRHFRRGLGLHAASLQALALDTLMTTKQQDVLSATATVTLQEEC